MKRPIYPAGNNEKCSRGDKSLSRVTPYKNAEILLSWRRSCVTLATQQWLVYIRVFSVPRNWQHTSAFYYKENKRERGNNIISKGAAGPSGTINSILRSLLWLVNFFLLLLLSFLLRCCEQKRDATLPQRINRFSIYVLYGRRRQIESERNPNPWRHANQMPGPQEDPSGFIDLTKTISSYSFWCSSLFQSIQWIIVSEKHRWPSI